MGIKHFNLVIDRLIDKRSRQAGFRFRLMALERDINLLQLFFSLLHFPLFGNSHCHIFGGLGEWKVLWNLTLVYATPVTLHTHTDMLASICKYTHIHNDSTHIYPYRHVRTWMPLNIRTSEQKNLDCHTMSLWNDQSIRMGLIFHILWVIHYVFCYLCLGFGLVL